ncbi:transposable element Tcb1 transposase [Trichonephila clavipes]|nr:transposable element Tcb1 transposase [Trichonephila clavipes]
MPPFGVFPCTNTPFVWRSRGECINTAFALQRYSATTAGEMVWCFIAYNTRSPLVLIHGNMTPQRYVHYILQPHVLQLMQRLPGAFFHQDNARPSHGKGFTRLSLHCYYPSLACLIHRFFYNRAYLGKFLQPVGHPTSLNKLEVRLQQIWNETSQGILQNLYASMSNRIESCIRDRGDSTGY